MDTKERIANVDALIEEAEQVGEGSMPGWAKEPFGMMKAGMPTWAPPPDVKTKESLPEVPGVQWADWLTKEHFRPPKKGDTIIVNGSKWVIEKVIGRGWMAGGSLKGKSIGHPAWAVAVKRPRGKKMMGVRVVRPRKHPGSVTLQGVAIDLYTGSRNDNDVKSYFRHTF